MMKASYLLKNLTIFPMEELSKPKNFNENLNFKMSNMKMNIKIKYLKKKIFSYSMFCEKNSCMGPKIIEDIKKPAKSGFCCL